MTSIYPGVYQESRELLFDRLNAEEIQRWLIPVGFTDWQTTHRRLQRIANYPQARSILANLLPYLLMMLTSAANPDRALVSLERFLQGSAAPSERLAYLARNLRATEILIKLFAGSQFLTEILLRNPDYFEILVEHQHLSQPKTLAQLCREAPHAGDAVNTADHLDALRRFQRWELLRIGACDLLDLFDLPLVTEQLSYLADSLVQASLNAAARETNHSPEGFVVLAMGKLGGLELNYSSDIDLLFLAEQNAADYTRLGERLIDGLTRMSSEGFLYRVDMRLRPWGRSGPLVTSRSGYLGYLHKHARTWEKQALLKARVVAGDATVGRDFLRDAAPVIFGVDNEEARRSVSRMRQLTEDHLHEHGQAWGEVKLGAGSIRDVEFATQFLQLVHGHRHPELHTGNTLDALAYLYAGGWISQHDHRILADGYVFLRTIEHYLQMMHYRQTHALPDDAEALAQLARRLGFEGSGAGRQFTNRYEQHRAAVRGVYLKYLGEEPMTELSSSDQVSQARSEHVARMDASYTSIFTPGEIERHTVLATRLNRDNLVEVQATPLQDQRWRVTIVGYDYPGELSLICGLLFVHGFSIEDGHVFTYEPSDNSMTPPDERKRHTTQPRKIVDVFTVQAVHEGMDAATWNAYALELASLLTMMQRDQRREARGTLAKRVASAIATVQDNTPTLYPVEIEIDNKSSAAYTILRITAPDTIGFLYEFTNALAYSRIYIARVSVASYGNRAHDVLYVTDTYGRKITSEEQERELRAAVVLIKHFTHLLPHTPDPETALLHFREFISQLFRQPNWPDELASLENPEVLNAMARLLGVSEFLWDDFLRMQYPNLFPVVQDTDALETKKTRPELQEELESALAEVHAGPQPPQPDAPWRETLNAFKDREMFRIDMRHILGHTQEFWDFSEELTALAEVVVNAAYHLCHEDLRSVHGTPYLENGDLSDMTVCALGKCGGRELGFASDIELMFIYSGNGMTSGSQAISTAEFYERLVQMFLQVIKAKREGIFEIDLRLRPYGKSGSMSVSQEAFRRYFAPDGPAWAYERQALVKLRPIAGNGPLGDQVVAWRDDFVYNNSGFDVASMRAMRERQIRHLVTGGTFNAKYSPGGLVDVEYLVQGLQIAHGHQDPALRSTNIRAAMAALAQAGLLTQDDYPRLRRAHTFLRWLIDGLRMVRGNAKDLTVPPMESEAFAFLARRLRYGNDIERLGEDLTTHTTVVQTLNRRLLG